MRTRTLPAWAADLAVLGALCLLAFALHGSALQGSWRWDDGQHLFYLGLYSPWSVFMDPQVTRAVSGNQFAPWNLFIYQVNHALFGLEPFGYYLHHLLSLAGAAFALYLLLRHWLGRWQALLPAALLLMGAPAVHMAQQLMSGHYVNGMLFACLGLWAYVHAVRKAQWRWALLAAAFYLLSTLCKEVYVPWIALYLLLPLPAGAPRGLARWRFAAPALAVALGYAALRIAVFAGVGGYHQHALNSWSAVLAFAAELARVLTDGLLGANLLGVAAAVLCLACAVAGVLAQPAADRSRMLVGLGAAAVVVVFPLLFAVQAYADWMAYTRFLWVPWAAACVLWCLKWPARLARWKLAALLVFVAAAAQQSLAQRAHDRPIDAMFEAHYAFAMQPPEGQILAPFEFFSPISMTSMIMNAHAAQWILAPGQPHARPTLLRTPPADAAERTRIQVWSEACLCLVPLASLPPGQQDDAIRSQLANAGAVMPLGKTLPRVAHGYAGSIDAVAVIGRQLLVTGWTPTIGPGRKIVFTGFAPEAQARLEELVSTERPDIVQAYQRPDMLHAGFRATLGFADEASARAASEALCALVTGHLPGQEHQFLLLPVQGQKRCGNVLIPAPSTMEKEQG
ncbi:glycosyltransferase family 39 protein [Acidovorax sp.]|uniref:glycosyltransferase family 39 protein n=1 Tax=Acidovorax sp. TaxID=1872122 RepID=UPI002ACEAC0B|nr:glycosyltransferase family 39 protein [Acidovorax sp.]MDZ7862283.1 glycosyltransferase family 39 protein [Acidovorax sp.]